MSRHSDRPRVGILALQGGVAVHAAALAAAGADAVPVRVPADLDGLAALVLPGGESSVQLKLLDSSGLAQPLDLFVRSGAPVLATCAGLVLAAANVLEPPQPSFGWIDVDVVRNGWGRQIASRETVADDGITPLVLIRAPRVTRVGPGVEVFVTYRREPVALRAGHVVAAAFHPELTGWRGLHDDLVARCRPRPRPGPIADPRSRPAAALVRVSR